MLSDAFGMTLILFFLISVMLLILKPPWLFSSNGTMKVFGWHVTETHTPLTFPVVTYGILILTYLTLRSHSL